MTNHAGMLLGRAGFVAAMAMAMGGCVQTPSATEAMGAAPSNLELENGGLDEADEAPEFGDPGFAALPALVDVGRDEVLSELGALRAEAAPPAGARVFQVLVVWGHLPRPQDGAATGTDREPSAVTDWSGAIAVDHGALSVRRTVGFDERDAVRPRSDPSRVEFASHTQPFVDGLLLTVRTAGAPGALHMRTAAFSGDLDLGDVERDAGVRYLEDGHNGVFYVAQEVRPGCAQGLVFGRWRRAQAHFGGLRGKVYGAAGQVGVVRGLWGRRRDGQGVFFGKYIDAAGTWRGLFGGQYGDGRFGGVWGTRRPADRGVLAGRYFDGHERGDGHGLFVGRWREACSVR